jgi:hypothetical protein
VAKMNKQRKIIKEVLVKDGFTSKSADMILDDIEREAKQKVFDDKEFLIELNHNIKDNIRYYGFQIKQNIGIAFENYKKRHLKPIHDNSTKNNIDKKE